jgi:hypothetical protein
MTFDKSKSDKESHKRRVIKAMRDFQKGLRRRKSRKKQENQK